MSYITRTIHISLHRIEHKILGKISPSFKTAEKISHFPFRIASLLLDLVWNWEKIPESEFVSGFFDSLLEALSKWKEIVPRAILYVNRQDQ